MLWFSTVLIVGFGALTIFFGDPTFVQIKPTIIYAVFGVALLVGYFLRRALLQILLEAAFEGVDEQGVIARGERGDRGRCGVHQEPCRELRSGDAAPL